jgi:CDP-glucose 4,6-dehydratase
VPGTIRSILDGQRPIIRSDGTLVRDYFYIRDGVSAYVLLAEKLLAGEARGQAYNFSNETRVTVLELTELIVSLMGRRDLAPIIENTARNEIPHQYLSAERARRELGWKAQYTLEEALGETIEWYRAFFREVDRR